MIYLKSPCIEQNRNKRLHLTHLSDTVIWQTDSDISDKGIWHNLVDTIYLPHFYPTHLFDKLSNRAFPDTPIWLTLSDPAIQLSAASDLTQLHSYLTPPFDKSSWCSLSDIPIWQTFFWHTYVTRSIWYSHIWRTPPTHMSINRNRTH